MNKLLQLKRSLKKVEFVYIQPHNFPDPDAIASAFGLQFVLKQLNITSRIIISGFLSNKTVNDMIEKLKIKVYHISKVSLKPGSKIIVVDTKIGVSNITALKAEYIGYIDHHEGHVDKALPSGFYDLRTNIGACSSIIGEYILDLKVEKIPKNIATALLIGIYIDTLRLTRKTSPLDIKVVDRLYAFADIKFLDHVAVNILEIRDLAGFKAGIKSLKQIKDVGIFKLSSLRSGYVLGIICDFFIQLREMSLIIGYHLKRNNISISIRSENKRYDASRIITQIVGDMGVGGGHATMAAGMIDLNIVPKRFNFEKHLDKIVRKYV
ncbi:MAG: DHH family phosphoesterase [Spirochaetes bacterium]|nr:DHH family phosphoesterase [Spirochaetota bacterium]